MAEECGRAHGDVEAQQVADAQRDPSLFSVLYEANFDEVYAFVSRRVGSRTDAEDLTSIVFHNALANLNRFEWRGVPFVAWLMRIASNELADWARQRARPVPEVAAQSDTDLDLAERRAALFRSVRTLPDDQRRVVALRFAEQWTIKEVAADLGRSVGAVKQLQFRALSTLRAQLGEEHV